MNKSVAFTGNKAGVHAELTIKKTHLNLFGYLVVKVSGALLKPMLDQLIDTPCLLLLLRLR